MFLFIILIFFLAVLAYQFFKKPGTSTEQAFYDGPVSTAFEQALATQAINRIIESHPEGVFATSHPEYVTSYLDSIELDLPDGIHIEEAED